MLNGEDPEVEAGNVGKDIEIEDMVVDTIEPPKEQRLTLLVNLANGVVEIYRLPCHEVPVTSHSLAFEVSKLCSNNGIECNVNVEEKQKTDDETEFELCVCFDAQTVDQGSVHAQSINQHMNSDSVRNRPKNFRSLGDVAQLCYTLYQFVNQRVETQKTEDANKKELEEKQKAADAEAAKKAAAAAAAEANKKAPAEKAAAKKPADAASASTAASGEGTAARAASSKPVPVTPSNARFSALSCNFDKVVDDLCPDAMDTNNAREALHKVFPNFLAKLPIIFGHVLLAYAEQLAHGHSDPLTGIFNHANRQPTSQFIAELAKCLSVWKHEDNQNSKSNLTMTAALKAIYKTKNAMKQTATLQQLQDRTSIVITVLAQIMFTLCNAVFANWVCNEKLHNDALIHLYRAILDTSNGIGHDGTQFNACPAEQSNDTWTQGPRGLFSTT